MIGSGEQYGRISALAIEAATRPERLNELCETVGEMLGVPFFCLGIYDLADHGGPTIHGADNSTILNSPQIAREVAQHEGHGFVRMAARPAGTILGEREFFGERSDGTLDNDADLRRRILARIGGSTRSSLKLNDVGPHVDLALLSHDGPLYEASPEIEAAAPFLTPVLSRAIEAQRTVKALTRRFEALLSLFDRLSFAAVFTDRDGRISFSNIRFDELSADTDGIVAPSGILGPAAADDIPRFHAALKAAADPAGLPAATILSLKRRSHKLPLVARVFPTSDPEIGRDLVMTVIVDPEEDEHLSAQGLAALEILDSDQLGICELAVRGHDRTAIARMSGRSPEQVDRAMETIFRKLVCRDRAGLQRLAFATSPPVRPPRDDLT